MEGWEEYFEKWFNQDNGFDPWEREMARAAYYAGWHGHTTGFHPPEENKE